MLVDCRGNNNITVKYCHLILRINGMLDRLHKSVLHTKIDLKFGYQQIGKKLVMNEKYILRPNKDCIND